MTRFEAIGKATKVGFERGFSVRFTADGKSVVVVRRINRYLYIMWEATVREDGSYAETPCRFNHRIMAKDLRGIPAPEPENQKGFE
jgi:hypothetical protein